MHDERVQPLSLVQHIPEPLTIEPPLVQIIMRVIDAAPHIAIAALVVFAVYIHCRYTVRAVIVDNSAEFGDVDSDEMIALNALEDGDLDADDEGKGGGGHLEEQDGLAERRASAPSLQRFLRKVKSVVLLRRSTNAEDLAAPAQECSQPRNPFFSPPAQKPSEPTSTPPILRRMVTTAVKVVPVVATYRRTAFAALFIAVFFVDTERSKLGMAHPTFYELCMLIIVTFAWRCDVRAASSFPYRTSICTVALVSGERRFVPSLAQRIRSCMWSFMSSSPRIGRIGSQG